MSAQKKGVKIFYVTNRRTVYEEATKNNVKKLGLPFDDDIDVLLTRGENGWGSSKASRRSHVSKDHRVIMMFGDNLNDCLLYTSPSPRDRYGSRMPSSA